MTNEKITRESVIKDVISIFIDAIAFLDEDEKNMVSENTHIIKDFKMQDCDFLVFDMDLEKHFSVKLSNEDWEQAVHIHEIADLIIKNLREKP